MNVFKGRALKAANLNGKVLVSRCPFDVYGGLREGAVVKDQSNPDLNGLSLEGKILCLNCLVGMDEGIYDLLELIKKGKGPIALLYKKNIDPLGALLLTLLPDESTFAIIDNLGGEFLDLAKTGTEMTLLNDGTVELL